MAKIEKTPKDQPHAKLAMVKIPDNAPLIEKVQYYQVPTTPREILTVNTNVNDSFSH